jgi:hypothetical protein
LRVLAILATIGAILASSTANAEWAVTRYVDPITDELNFSATVMGKSRSVFFISASSMPVPSIYRLVLTERVPAFLEASRM